MHWQHLDFGTVYLGNSNDRLYGLSQINCPIDWDFKQCWTWLPVNWADLILHISLHTETVENSLRGVITVLSCGFIRCVFFIDFSALLLRHRLVGPLNFLNFVCSWCVIAVSCWSACKLCSVLKGKVLPPQKKKFSHYLLTSMPMESRVKICSPQNISECWGKTEWRRSPKHLKSMEIIQNQNIEKHTNRLVWADASTSDHTQTIDSKAYDNQLYSESYVY